MDSSGLITPSQAAYSFNDLSGLQAIASLGRRNKGAALDQVARQFESFFISQLLKGMRAANEMFGDDNPMNSNEMQFRQEMLDQQLALSLSQGRGLGLAETFARQLRQQMGVETPAATPLQAVLDQGELARRDIDAVKQPVVRMLPPILKSALEVIQPVLDQVREKINEVARFDSKESFVQAIMPYARKAAATLGVDPRVLVAQAALETGWGRSIIANTNGSSHNLFNIKSGSYWQGPSIGVSTLEFKNGIPQPERAMFRAYQSFAESFADYASVLQNSPRYQRALEHAADAVSFVRGLQQAGYATDPQYADKVLGVLQDAAIAGTQ